MGTPVVLRARILDETPPGYVVEGSWLGKYTKKHPLALAAVR
jgi:hypothetical protein